MSINKRPGGPYVVPLLSDDGSEAVAAGPRGKYTLTASKTYYAVLGGAGSPTQSAHLSWDNTLVLTGVTVEECNADEKDVTDISTVVGDWIKDNGSAGLTSVVGTGATPTARTVAHTGSNAGGAMFQLPDRGARRMRLAIVVGATGGVLRIAAHGKA